METVQLQCGHCRKVMAISVEHLGGQVQCPHCKGVVQTPPRDPAPEPPAPLPNMELQRESIFAGPEASDSVIGEPPSPRVEMPSEPSASVETPSSPEAEPDADLTRFKPRPIYEKSVLGMYALIFLVPYAILTTLAILYLVFMQQGRPHPFDMMPDPLPDPKKGGTKRITRTVPTIPLAEHQKVAIGKSIHVGKDGDLLVTPEKIVWTDEGELQMFLRAKNISTDTAFEPIHDSWVRYDANKKQGEPYTFLESRSRNIANIFGAYLAFRKNGDDRDLGSVVLRPEQETTIVLTTERPDKAPAIAAIAKSNDTYTWRVQLRRGFVKFHDKDVSATAVIGVEFTTAEIGGKKG